MRQVGVVVSICREMLQCRDSTTFTKRTFKQMGELMKQAEEQMVTTGYGYVEDNLMGRMVKVGCVRSPNLVCVNCAKKGG